MESVSRAQSPSSTSQNCVVPVSVSFPLGAVPLTSSAAGLAGSLEAIMMVADFSPKDVGWNRKVTLAEAPAPMTSGKAITSGTTKSASEDAILLIRRSQSPLLDINNGLSLMLPT
ncbi:MAG: hypothetical protein ABJH85_12575, partial [Paracoccaceae bacterium]